MNPFFLKTLQEHLTAMLADFRLEWRGEGDAPEGYGVINVYVGDLPPKKRRPGTQGALADSFPCVVLVPVSGESLNGEESVTVALVCGVFCGEGGDAEGAETDCALFLSRLRQALWPCFKKPLDNRYRMAPDEKGRQFPWEKSDLQPRPYIQAAMMTRWCMKGLE